MIKSHSRGWDIYFDGVNWRYTDNNKIIDNLRPCKKCGQMPTKDGHDVCLGYIKGVISACCGHGVEKPYILYEQ